MILDIAMRQACAGKVELLAVVRLPGNEAKRQPTCNVLARAGVWTGSDGLEEMGNWKPRRRHCKTVKLG